MAVLVLALVVVVAITAGGALIGRQITESGGTGGDGGGGGGRTLSVGIDIPSASKRTDSDTIRARVVLTFSNGAVSPVTLKKIEFLILDSEREILDANRETVHLEVSSNSAVERVYSVFFGYSGGPVIVTVLVTWTDFLGTELHTHSERKIDIDSLLG